MKRLSRRSLKKVKKRDRTLNAKAKDVGKTEKFVLICN